MTFVGLFFSNNIYFFKKLMKKYWIVQFKNSWDNGEFPLSYIIVYEYFNL
jgi:hypothetical protein